MAGRCTDQNRHSREAGTASAKMTRKSAKHPLLYKEQRIEVARESKAKKIGFDENMFYFSASERAMY